MRHRRQRGGYCSGDDPFFAYNSVYDITMRAARHQQEMEEQRIERILNRNNGNFIESFFDGFNQGYGGGNPRASEVSLLTAVIGLGSCALFFFLCLGALGAFR